MLKWNMFSTIAICLLLMAGCMSDESAPTGGGALDWIDVRCVAGMLYLVREEPGATYADQPWRDEHGQVKACP